ncbi:MAG TPA: TetR/AcrR family transcriptional regulator [Solirubrobacteraceae bacterium]
MAAELAGTDPVVYDLTMRSAAGPGRQKQPTFTGAARRAQIVAAAIDTIAEVGYGQASLARIAQRVGISKGVIVYHFDSKEELVKAVVVEVLSKARDYIVPRIEAASGGRGKLCAYIDSNIGFMGEYRSHLIAVAEIARGARDPAGNRTIDAYSLESGTAALAQLLGSFQASGEFREDFDSRVMAETIRAAIDAIPRRLAAKPDLDIDVYRRELTGLFDVATRSETTRAGRRA